MGAVGQIGNTGPKGECCCVVGWGQVMGFGQGSEADGLLSLLFSLSPQQIDRNKSIIL